MEQFEVLIAPKAEKELAESWLWYEAQEKGLGDRFRTSAIVRARSLKERPLRYHLQKSHYRHIVMRDFPFLVVFRVNQRKRKVTITSFFHTSRNPKNRYGST